MNSSQYREYKSIVNRELALYRTFSVGGARRCCAQCEDDWNDDCQGQEFSTQPCDLCGSTLGGAREPAHGTNMTPTPDGDQEMEVTHYDVCVDCAYFSEYGTLDDQTILDMEDDR
jgi:hypothetical protein